MKFENVPCGFLFHDRVYRPGDTVQGEVYIGLSPDVLAWSRIDIALVGVSVVAIRSAQDPLSFSESSSRLLFRHALLTHGGVTSSPSTKFPFSIRLPSSGDEWLTDRSVPEDARFKNVGPEVTLPPSFEADHEYDDRESFAVSIRYDLVVRAVGIGFFKAPLKFGPEPTSPDSFDRSFRTQTMRQSIQSQELIPEDQRPRGASGFLKSTFKQTPGGVIELDVQTPTHAYAGHMLQLNLKASLKQDANQNIIAVLPPVSIDRVSVSITCRTTTRGTNGRGWQSSGSVMSLYSEVLFSNAKASLRMSYTRADNNTEDVPVLTQDNEYEATLFSKPLSAGYIHSPFTAANVSRRYSLNVRINASCAGFTILQDWSTPLSYETPDTDAGLSSTLARPPPPPTTAITTATATATAATTASDAAGDMREPAIVAGGPVAAPPPAYSSAPASPSDERPAYFDTVSASELDDFFKAVVEDTKPQSDKWRNSPSAIRRMVREEIHAYIYKLSGRTVGSYVAGGSHGSGYRASTTLFDTPSVPLVNAVLSGGGGGDGGFGGDGGGGGGGGDGGGGGGGGGG